MTQEEILSRLLSDISDEFDKSVGSFFYDIEKPIAKELANLKGRIEEILKNGFALTATGSYLDAKVLEQGILRKSATCANATVLVTGNPGSAVSKGDKVASDELVFSITNDVALDENGAATVTAVCDTSGSIGNIPIGAVNRFPVTLAGLVSVTNITAGEGGFDEETDDELRARYYEKVALPVSSGNKYHYIMWAKEVSGVGDARCLPLWNGNGTVKVVVINSEKGVANDELISNVAAYIEENRPIGATVTVESATPLVINVSVSLILSGGATLDKAKEKISESIINYLKLSAFSSTYISYAQIGKCILNCSEIADYKSLTINGLTDNIEIAETEVPVMGVIEVV